MALIVEDGTGMATAEAYASVAAADAYWTARGIPAAWSGSTTAQKEEALRQGADYIDAVHAEGWKGYRLALAQRLAWPRTGVYVDRIALDAAPLPRQLVEANIEAAVRARTETTGLLPDETELGIASESVEVGPIKESKSYIGSKSTRKTFARIDALLRPLLSGVGSMERA